MWNPRRAYSSQKIFFNFSQKTFFYSNRIFYICPTNQLKKIKMTSDKITKFWAIHYGILEKVQKGLTINKASKLYRGEQLEAAHYFLNWVKTT
jgi:hypothetical protein